MENINEEVISAIMAAIAAMERPGCKLVVRSFRRVQQSAPVWSATGRYERLRSKI